MSLGSVLFYSALNSIVEDNSNLFWDSVNKRFGIGTISPADILHLRKATANGIILEDSSRGANSKAWKLTTNGDSLDIQSFSDAYTNLGSALKIDRVAGVPSIIRAGTALKLGTSAITPEAGMVRWSGSQFQFYNGSSWVSLGTKQNFNVKDAPYNAKGDGVTDDTVAIQAAITAAQAANGQVYLPNGTYNIGTQLVMSSAFSASIVGESQGGTILNPTAALASVLKLRNCRNCLIENLTIWGNGPSILPAICIEFNNAGITGTPRGNIVRHCALGGFVMGSIVNGIEFTGIDINNDYHKFEEVEVRNFSGCAYRFRGANNLFNKIEGGLIQCDLTTGYTGVYGIYTDGGSHVDVDGTAFEMTNATDATSFQFFMTGSRVPTIISRTFSEGNTPILKIPVEDGSNATITFENCNNYGGMANTSVIKAQWTNGNLFFNGCDFLFGQPGCTIDLGTGSRAYFIGGNFYSGCGVNWDTTGGVVCIGVVGPPSLNPSSSEKGLLYIGCKETFGGGLKREGYIHIPTLTTANLPAGHALLEGILLCDKTTPRIVTVINGTRYAVALTALP